jgi:hypothetical protein
MNRVIAIIVLIIAASSGAHSQSFTDSSLPIVVISTDGGVQVPDEPGVMAGMKIISRGGGARNYLTDADSLQFLNYNGRIDIELRGSSTQVLPKKQYGFTTKLADDVTSQNVELLGLPSENDWILNAMGFDPLRIRDYLCYNLSRKTGEYASGTVYCELVLNGTYMGLFLLQEKVKADDDRVNVIKIRKADKYLPDLTGGYITKSDKTTGGDPIAWYMPSYVPNDNVGFIHVIPEWEDVNAEQNDYIKNEFQKLDYYALFNYASVETGYPSVIDIPSFADYIIISELSSNADAYRFSTFYHKDRNGRLRAGPIWDNDLTFGNDIFMWGYNRSKTDVWQLANGDNEGPLFWRALFSSPEFKCYLSRRWQELTAGGSVLNYSSLADYIDQTVGMISEAAGRDWTRWSIQGSYSDRINEMKSWLQQRINWMTWKIGTPAGCPEPVIPTVAITKINYHPKPTIDFPDPNDLEFIEITNTGSKITSLSGAYFLGTGFVYQFPPYTVLKPGASWILANDAYAFKMTYGFNPAGEFTRNLSDKGEKLILANGFGYIIDYVKYSDTIPWPDADGNGYYLELTDHQSDNSDPASWIANKNSIVSVNAATTEIPVSIYPIPADDRITVNSGDVVSRLRILNLQGAVLADIEPAERTFQVDLDFLDTGIYIIRLETAGSQVVRKIIKK